MDVTGMERAAKDLEAALVEHAKARVASLRAQLKRNKIKFEVRESNRQLSISAGEKITEARLEEVVGTSKPVLDAYEIEFKANEAEYLAAANAEMARCRYEIEKVRATQVAG